MPRHDETKSSSSLFLGFMGVLVIVLIIVLVQGLFFRMENDELARKSLPGLGAEAELLRQGQEQQLTDYARVDGGADEVRLPISRAMELVVEEYGQK